MADEFDLPPITEEMLRRARRNEEPVADDDLPPITPAMVKKAKKAPAVMRPKAAAAPVPAAPKPPSLLERIAPLFAAGGTGPGYVPPEATVPLPAGTVPKPATSALEDVAAALQSGTQEAFLVPARAAKVLGVPGLGPGIERVEEQIARRYAPPTTLPGKAAASIPISLGILGTSAGAALVGGPAAGVATAVAGTGALGLSEGEKTYRDLVKKGIPANIARKVATVVGASETATEGLSTIIDMVGAGLLGKVSRPVLKTILQTTFGEFGTEELNTFIQASALRAGAKASGLDPNQFSKPPLTAMREQAAPIALTSALLGGGATAFGRVTMPVEQRLAEARKALAKHEKTAGVQEQSTPAGKRRAMLQQRVARLEAQAARQAPPTLAPATAPIEAPAGTVEAPNVLPPTTETPQDVVGVPSPFDGAGPASDLDAMLGELYAQVTAEDTAPAEAGIPYSDQVGRYLEEQGVVGLPEEQQVKLPRGRPAWSTIQKTLESWGVVGMPTAEEVDRALAYLYKQGAPLGPQPEPAAPRAPTFWDEVAGAVAPPEPAAATVPAVFPGALTAEERAGLEAKMAKWHTVGSRSDAPKHGGRQYDIGEIAFGEETPPSIGLAAHEFAHALDEVQLRGGSEIFLSDEVWRMAEPLPNGNRQILVDAPGYTPTGKWLVADGNGSELLTRAYGHMVEDPEAVERFAPAVAEAVNRAARRANIPMPEEARAIMEPSALPQSSATTVPAAEAPVAVAERNEPLPSSETPPAAAQEVVSAGPVDTNSAGKRAADFLVQSYGETRMEDAHNAPWIAPDGRLVGDRADHQQSAQAALEQLGQTEPNEYAAVKRLQQATGIVRLSGVGDEINIDVAAPLTDKQIATVRSLVRRNPTADFRYDLYRPGDEVPWASGSDINTFEEDAEAYSGTVGPQTASEAPQPASVAETPAPAGKPSVARRAEQKVREQQAEAPKPQAAPPTLADDTDLEFFFEELGGAGPASVQARDEWAGEDYSIEGNPFTYAGEGFILTEGGEIVHRETGHVLGGAGNEYADEALARLREEWPRFAGELEAVRGQVAEVPAAAPEEVPAAEAPAPTDWKAHLQQPAEQFGRVTVRPTVSWSLVKADGTRRGFSYQHDAERYAQPGDTVEPDLRWSVGQQIDGAWNGRQFTTRAEAVEQAQKWLAYEAEQQQAYEQGKKAHDAEEAAKVKKKEERRQRRIPTAQGISDFEVGKDRVERRGSRAYVVGGDKAPVEVRGDFLTDEGRENLRKLTPEQIPKMAAAIRDTPYLSPEGKRERLEFIASLSAGPSARQTYRIAEPVTVTNTQGKDVTLPAGEEYTVYPLGDGKVRLQDGKQVTVFEGELEKVAPYLLPPGEQPMAGGMVHEDLATRILEAYDAGQFTMDDPRLTPEARKWLQSVRPTSGGAPPPPPEERTTATKPTAAPTGAQAARTAPERPATGERAAPSQLTHATSDVAREDLGLPTRTPATPQTEEQWKAGAEGLDAERIVQKAKSGEALQPEEHARLSQAYDRKKGELDEITARMEQFEAAGARDEALRVAAERESALAVAMEYLDAADKAGTAWGRAGRARQMFLLENQSAPVLLHQARKAKGSALTPKEVAEYEAMAKQIAALEEEAKKARILTETQAQEIAALKAQGQQKMDSAHRQAKNVAPKQRADRIAKIRQDREQILNDLKNLGQFRVYDVTGLTAEASVLVTRLAASYIHEGALTIADVAAQLRQHLPDLSDEQILQAIGTKGPSPSPEAVERGKSTRGLREEARLRLSGEMQKLAEKKARALLEGGVTNLQDLIDKLREVVPDLSDLDAYRAIAGPDRKMRQLELQEAMAKAKRDRLKAGVRDRIEAMRPRTMAQKAGETILDAMGFSTTLAASGDVSAVGRQGLRPLLSHPVIGARAIGTMLKAMGNEAYAHKVRQDIEESEDAIRLQRMGVELTDWDGADLTHREEGFVTRMLDKVRQYKVGRASTFHIPPSNRAFATFANVMRNEVARKLEAQAVRGGHATDADLKAIGNYINVTMGRGNWFKSSSKVLSRIFWAPRLALSQFEVPFTLLQGSNATKMMLAGEMAKWLGATTLMVILADLSPWAEVEKDPRSSEFGQIRIGPHVIDPWAGLRVAGVFSAHFLSGQTSRKDQVRNLAQEYTVGRFARSKLAQLPGLMWSWVAGKDFAGNPSRNWQSVAGLAPPLSWREIYEAGKAPEGAGLLSAIGVAPASLMGLGVTTYSDKNAATGPPKPLTDAEYRRLMDALPRR